MQRPEHEQPYEVCSTSSRELEVFVKSNIVGGQQVSATTIWQAIVQSPKALTRRVSQEHSIPKSTVWRILRIVLKKKSYYIQMFHHLEPEDSVVCSPDLTPLDFFTRGHIKSQVNTVKVRNLCHLRQRISASVRRLTPKMLRQVFRCTEDRW
ncbi:hypothetical protein C0J52_16700 [Blattella germanica]|nr:hypothetical protein C0J52_16700 [Blattella germanica]